MKFLAIVTIVMSIPNVIGCFWGMNVGGIPYAHDPTGFWKIVIFSLVITIIGTIWLERKNLFK